VNVIEVLIPGLFPLWMRAVMVGMAVVMAAVMLLVVRERAAADDGRAPTI
jgi:hypothetical protein